MNRQAEQASTPVAEQIRALLHDPEETSAAGRRPCEQFELNGLVFIEAMGSDWDFVQGCLVIDTRERIGPFLFRTGTDNTGEYRYPIGAGRLRDAITITRFLESLADDLEPDAAAEPDEGDTAAAHTTSALECEPDELEEAIERAISHLEAAPDDVSGVYGAHGQYQLGLRTLRRLLEEREIDAV